MSTSTQTWRDVLSCENITHIAEFDTLVTAALQSQYSASPRIRALCDIFQEMIDATPDLLNALEKVYEPSQAEGVFLDWWGERVGVKRNVEINGVDTRLDDDYYRFLIFYRAMANISNGTIAEMNRLLTTLMGMPVFVIDNLDMTISVRVIGQPTDLQVMILQNYGLLTRGAGVGYNIIIQNPETAVFGFRGSNLKPFNQGVFNPSREISINAYELSTVSVKRSDRQ